MNTTQGPAKRYPATTMTDAQLVAAVAPHLSRENLPYWLRDAANAALRHAIDSGQLVIATVKE